MIKPLKHPDFYFQAKTKFIKLESQIFIEFSTLKSSRWRTQIQHLSLKISLTLQFCPDKSLFFYLTTGL